MGLDTKMPIMDSKKVILKSLEEITLLQKSAQLVSKTLGMLAKEIKPGIDTLYLDKIAEEFIRDHKGIPGFLGMYDFPNTLCVSTNHEVVHGIPNKKPLEDGDIVSIDCGVLMNDFYGDHAYTFEVGQVSDEIKKLLKTAKESLYMGIDNFRIGNRVGDISYSIQKHNETQGYGVVKELVGAATVVEVAPAGHHLHVGDVLSQLVFFVSSQVVLNNIFDDSPCPLWPCLIVVQLVLLPVDVLAKRITKVSVLSHQPRAPLGRLVSSPRASKLFHLHL